MKRRSARAADTAARNDVKIDARTILIVLQRYAGLPERDLVNWCMGMGTILSIPTVLFMRRSAFISCIPSLKWAIISTGATPHQLMFDVLIVCPRSLTEGKEAVGPEAVGLWCQ